MLENLDVLWPKYFLYNSNQPMVLTAFAHIPTVKKINKTYITTKSYNLKLLLRLD